MVFSDNLFFDFMFVSLSVLLISSLIDFMYVPPCFPSLFLSVYHITPMDSFSLFYLEGMGTK